MNQTHSPEIKAFIHEHSSLFWYTPEEKKDEISKEFLLETILNYGTLKDSLRLIEMIGSDKAMKILQSTKGRRKMNYYPEIYNFFTLYLRRNAQRNIRLQPNRTASTDKEIQTDLLNLASMKAYALEKSSKWKDYVDLYYILKDHYSVKQIVEVADNIYGQMFSEKLFRAQLSYFEDIDYGETIEFLNQQPSEEEIKELLVERAVRVC